MHWNECALNSIHFGKLMSSVDTTKLGRIQTTLNAHWSVSVDRPLMWSALVHDS